MDSGLIDGALLAGIGIAVVFTTLAILMAVMWLMGRGFRDKGQEPIPTAGVTEPIVSGEGEDSSQGEVVAAIALALSLAQPEPGLPVQRKGALRERLPNRWAMYGRQQLMDSRGRTRQQW